MITVAGQTLSPRALSAETAFDFMRGDWTLKRRILSGKDRPVTMHGAAAITPLSPDQAHYHECVLVQIAEEKPLAASQSYTLSRSANGFTVLFATSGVLFHKLVFTSLEDGSLVAQAEHLCGKDRYRSAYRLGSRSGELARFEIKHVVDGPRKSYKTHAIYRRSGEAAYR